MNQGFLLKRFHETMSLDQIFEPWVFDDRTIDIESGICHVPFSAKVREGAYIYHPSTTGSFWSCVKCNTEAVNYRDLYAHCQTKEHQVQRNATHFGKCRQTLTFARSLEIRRRIKVLRSPAWIDDINDHLMRIECNEYGVTWKTTLKQKVAWYFFLESLSLLEQAVWKHACMLYHKDCDVRMTFLDFNDWIQGGWQTQKAAMRHHSSISVIVENVIPFLIRTA